VDKRTKILLIVLGVLILLAGGYYGYIYLMPGEETMTAQAPAPVAKAPAKPSEAKPVETVPAEAKPAEQPAGAVQEPPAAKPGEAPKEAAAPAQKAVEKPAAAVAEKPEAQQAAKPEAKAAPCVPTLKTTVKGKTSEFKTAEEFVEKSGMDEKAMRDYGAKNLNEAKGKLGKLEKAKTKAKAEDVDCAKKELSLAEQLVKLIESKFKKEPAKENYRYSSLDKRDPFMSPLEIPKVYPAVPKNAAPLERVPSEQLDVDGIMWNEKGFRALVVTPDGRGYTVKVGDTVGNKRGKIIRISEKRVYIEERIPDIFGDIEVRSIVLKLHKEAE